MTKTKPAQKTARFLVERGCPGSRNGILAEERGLFPLVIRVALPPEKSLNCEPGNAFRVVRAADIVKRSKALKIPINDPKKLGRAAYVCEHMGRLIP